MAQSQGEQISVSNPSPLLEFIVNMSYYAIHLSITSYLPIPDIISLTRTSKQLSGLYTYLLKTQYSIDKRLSPYFVDPDAFRMVQAETNALIFGDVATGFFDRSRWEDERLMIAVDDGKNFDKLSGYMQSMGYIEKMMAVRESKEFDEISEHIQQRGYMDCGDVCEEEHKREQSEAYFHPDSDTLYDLRAKFSMVFLYSRPRNSIGSRRPFQKIIICTTKRPVVSALLSNFRATHEACLISWNKAFCLYPISTTQKRRTYVFDPLEIDYTLRDPSIAKMMRRAETSGLKCKAERWEDYRLDLEEKLLLTSREISEMYSRRYLADRYSWVIDLPKPASSNEAAPDWFLDMSSFKLREVHHQGYEIEHQIFHSPVLKYSYTHAPRDSSRLDIKSWRWLKHETNTLTRLHLWKLDERERPSNFDDLIADPQSTIIGGEWIKPVSWVYYDEDVQAFVERILEAF